MIPPVKAYLNSFHDYLHGETMYKSKGVERTTVVVVVVVKKF